MRLLIVDDEIQIRTGLQEGIPWDTLGFEEVYTAQNGVEALEICNIYKPEIVITDIRIPGMSGLELGRVIKRRYEPVEVIVLSGYSEFEYAREAISIRVFQYLLKPIQINELIKCVQGAKQKIEEFWIEHQSRNEYQVLNRTRTLQQILRTYTLLDKEKEKQLQEQMKQPFLNNIMIGVFSVDLWLEQEKPSIVAFLEREYQEVLQRLRAEELFWEKGNLFFIVDIFSEHDRKRKLSLMHEELAKINDLLKKEFQLTTSIAVSENGNVKEAALLFGEAERVLKKRLYLGNASFLEKEVSDAEQKLTLNPVDAATVQMRLENFDYMHIHCYIQEIFQELEEKRVTSIDLVKSVCEQLKNILLQTMMNKGIDLAGIFEHNQKLLNEIPDYLTLKEYETWIEDLYQVILQGLSTLSGKQHSRVVLQAVDYISKNYAKNINLEMTAEYVNKSKNYFSYLFKKELGISFVEYLNQVRIEAAKKLLDTTDHKTYEISDQVGYSDYKYFSSVFKKLTGMSPAQYKKQLKS